jgi:hypothetical protein
MVYKSNLFFSYKDAEITFAHLHMQQQENQSNNKNKDFKIIKFSLDFILAFGV